jgi:hypothetical protein
MTKMINTMRVTYQTIHMLNDHPDDNRRHNG